MSRFGLSSDFYREMTVEHWMEAKAAGFDHVELGMLASLDPERRIERCEEQFELLKQAGMDVSSVHLPFSREMDPSRLDDAGRDEALAQFRRLIDWASEKHIGIAVIHASSEPIPSEERAARLQTAQASIQTLGAYAKARNVHLAVENLPRTCLGNCASDMLYLTQKGAAASMCFDVNHLLEESHKDYYEQTAPYIVTTHLSDYDFVDERHWMPGEGDIDWEALIAAFRRQGYAGRLIFEIDEMAAPSLGRPMTAAELMDRFKKVSKY